ncbi:MAG: bifunctional diaminohydroxyphosphoribosylaminopyrimidine deaminase/5-amino-6-(5-phosphoribosylamino)uracil reductase RibD [Paracoccaceae bacterium]|nr:bifunctional diaminohydroxyphosphoribosylaminopyrimidine deaminase/5-amino-6-(5-phosphoribosylamino)uracil reductase RibD [Paracoccaceae bacterium]
MGQALALGRRGLGRVSPNPAVGCVIVLDGRVVGRGRTADGGRPHAETEALATAGSAARGATAYVTLEPCAHHGETAPCVDALIAADVARVVIAHSDPDPRVSGQGVAKLEEAGIQVDIGVEEQKAKAIQRGFLTRLEAGRPMLTLKLALTLDGRIATASGESRWITGSEARRMVHAERARHDAVLVGAGTARDDDPDLRVRGLGIDHQPIRIVASRHLRLPRPSRLLASANETPVWLCHSEAEETERAAWTEAGARLMEVPARQGQIDLPAMLAALGEAGLTRVFCEGGGTLAAGLLAADLVDELVVFSAGALIGAEGRPSVGALGVSALAEAPRFRLESVARVGNDVVQRWERP